jgi:hypothetical protein
VFIAGFLVGRTLLLLMYLPPLRHVQRDQVRNMIRVYLAGYAAGGILITLTLLAPAGERPWLGAAVVIAETAIPWVAWRHLTGRTVNVSHLAQRFGPFTILLVGQGWLARLGLAGVLPVLAATGKRLDPPVLTSVVAAGLVALLVIEILDRPPREPQSEAAE